MRFWTRSSWTVVICALLLAPAAVCLFYNNDSLAMMTAEHIDTGSIVGSVLETTSRENFYNNAAAFHTRAYGSSFYFLFFWFFSFLKYILGLSEAADFSVFALTARLATFATSCLALFLVYRLSIKLAASRLAAALANATGKQVALKVVVDPTVLGGIVAVVGDTVIDGTVRSRLDQLKAVL